jgi:hypothetical protein
MNFYIHKTHTMNTRPTTLSLAGFLSLLSVTGLGWYFSSVYQGAQTARVDAPYLEHEAAPSEAVHIDMSGMSFTERQAVRLKARLDRMYTFTPSVSDLSIALAERKALMQREVTATFSAASGEKMPEPWTVRLAQVPTWIRYSHSLTNPHFEISADNIEQYLRTAYIASLPVPRNATVLSVETDAFGVSRAKTDAIATAGYVYDIRQAAMMLASALTRGEPGVQWNVTSSGAGLTYNDGQQTYHLSLLATGISDFKDSPDNRVSNVRKLFDERLPGIIINSGEIFSFVNTLGGPVTLDKGWKEALGLFGGGAAMTPGAGICQGATTTYRAALLSGLQIVEKRNHSLFVDHYEKYGIGVDATIFPGFHDMRFKNTTQGPIVMQTYLQGDDAIVQFYGIPDGRSVTMEGPFFAGNVGGKLKQFGRIGLSHYDIAWIRTIHNADGTEKKELLVSTYAKPLWHSLMAKYIGNDRANTELHAAAPAPME